MRGRPGGGVELGETTVSDASGHGSADGPLGSVRQLEQALESNATASAAADKRLKDARTEAARLLAAAEENALAIAAERRRSVLAAADEEATRIHRAAEAKIERLRADARTTRPGTVEAALALLLSTGEESEV